MSAFKNFNLDLPQEATIYADKAYNFYEYEDFFKENDLFLIAERKENTKRLREGFLRFVQSYWRKRVETAFSRITSLFPKSIHAVTSKGFELKVFAFILVYSISLLL